MDYKNFREITYDTLSQLDEYFRRFSLPISEYTATNFFIWKDYYQFKYLIYDEHLFIISEKDREKLVIFPPVGPRWSGYLLDLINLGNQTQRKVEFHRVPESMLSTFKNHSHKFEVLEDRDNWDYVYKRSDLVELPGDQYEKVRKKMNKFKRVNQWQYKSINPEIVDILLRMQDLWCRYKACSEDVTLDQENEGIIEILNRWDELDIFGGAIFVKEIPVAYSIGEKLNDDTVVIHIEKASYEYQGAYQAIATEFPGHIDSKYRFINREQDLGEAGLRRSKQSYHPDHFIKKYIIKT